MSIEFLFIRLSAEPFIAGLLLLVVFGMYTIKKYCEYIRRITEAKERQGSRIG